MKHRKKYITLCFALNILYGFCHLANAQNILTVEDAIATSLQNNYDIRLLRNDSTLYELQNSYAYTAFLPRLNANGSMLFNNNNTKQELADGSKRSQNNLRSENFQASVNLNWTVFDGLKMFATRDKLEAFTQLGEWNVKNQMVNSIAEVTSLYYNIVSQKQQLKAIEEQMGINEERITQAEKKISTGLGAKPELLQARLDLNAQKAARITQISLIEKLKEDLNLLMSVKPGTGYDVTDSIPINRALMVDELLTTAEKVNPQIHSAKTQLSIAQLSLKEQRASRFPTVGLTSAYNFSNIRNHTAINPFTTLFNQNHGFNYGITATIPIFNGFSVKRQMKEAELEIDYRKMVYEYEHLKVKSTITAAYKDYLWNLQNLALEEENIDFAKENMLIASERYRLGLSVILELRESQKSLEDAFTRLIHARYNTKLSEITLLRMRGDLVR